MILNIFALTVLNKFISLSQKEENTNIWEIVEKLEQKSYFYTQIWAGKLDL